MLALAGCDGGASGSEDAGSRDGGAAVDGSSSDSGAPGEDGGGMGTDAGPGADGGVDPDGGGACEPSGGSAAGDAYCDLFELAIHDDGDGAVEARLYGRVSPDGLAEDGCAVIDEVEVLVGGTSVGTLPGAGAYAAGSERALLARGPALPEMTSRCDGDENRFGGFGLMVRGRIDGGSFEAACADAEGGGRWPPALRITCHENVDERPFSSYAMVDTFGGMTFTSVDVTVPHGPGGALTSVDGTAHVIPHAYPFGGTLAPTPFDITGLDASVSEGSGPVPGAYTQIYLSTMGDPFGAELCPEPGGDPSDDPPPVMLLRLTGSGERGAFSTEAYVDMCTRTSPPPGP